MGKQHEAYARVAELPPEAFSCLSCACCAWKLLRLCVTFGDAPRAAAFGAQLATLAAAAGKSKPRHRNATNNDVMDEEAGA